MAKILLVEDDKSLREIYEVRLRAEGYDIVSAGDGEEALALAIKEHPDLVISDVMMPKISGFDMLDILRSTSETKAIKVIMMTALSSEDQRARGESLGADKYLVKSQVGIEDVVRTVHEVLGDKPVAAPVVSPFSAPTAPTVTPPATTPTPAATPAPVTPPAAPVDAPVPVPATSIPVSAPALEPTAVTIAPPVINTPAEPAVPAAPVVTEPTAPVEPPAAASASTLPEPTAPFSSPAPASLGSRVIEPLTTPPANDIAAAMSRELGQAATPPAPPTPPAV